MTSSKAPESRPPLWVIAIIVICMLPVLAFPTLLAETATDTPARIFAWFYPFYVIVSGICAYICWPRRPEVTWVLLVIMLLTHAAMWMLVRYNI